VVLARLEEDAVAGTDHHDRSALTLAEAAIPSVTQIVWPCGCVCHAVRAPGVKWTREAPKRDASVGAVIASMNTDPVNQSLGPGSVSTVFLVICTDLSFLARSACRPSQPCGRASSFPG
jgi:hypothetical protein